VIFWHFLFKVITSRTVDVAVLVVCNSHFQVPKADAGTLSGIILDTLLRLGGLDKHLLRGQCYDGASVMSGNSSGVAKRINDI